MNQEQDAYGHLLLAHLDGRPATEIVERDDGFIEAGAVGPAGYFAPFRKWWKVERDALRFARGRVLDVGCGAGRVALHLQERGHDVVAIDVSPGAVEVCRRRRVRDVRELSVTQIDSTLGRFDTIVMYGNNFGLVANPRRAKWLLRRFRSITNDGALILAESRDPYGTDDPDHLAYHERNRRRGRMAGGLRLRVRHRRHVTPWFEYLIASPDEMREIVDGTGWSLREIVEGEAGIYVGVLART